jgi:hypothetical protein
MGSISSAIAAFVEWLKDMSPVLQGLFGGAGATLLWEGVLKPARERRSLAQVLAEEISLNLQIAAAMRIYLTRDARHVPRDFGFVTGTFTAVANRVGELPTRLVGPVILFYAGLAQANVLPPMYLEIMRRWQDAQDNKKAKGHLLPGIEAERDRCLILFDGAIDKAIERANELLPYLQRAAVPRWRLDYLVRKKRMLTTSEVQEQVDEVERRRAGGA